MCACSEIAVEEDEILLHSLILQLTHLLLTDSKRYNTQLQMKGNNYIVIERVLNYIQENLASDLSLETVSSFASQSHFSYVFKRKMNVTPREYVRNVSKRYNIPPSMTTPSEGQEYK